MADIPILPQSWYGKPVRILFRGYDREKLISNTLVDSNPVGMLTEHLHVAYFYPWHMVEMVRRDLE